MQVHSCVGADASIEMEQGKGGAKHDRWFSPLLLPSARRACPCGTNERVVTGIMAFSAPKRRGRHHRWGTGYVWAYTVVFLTATMLSVQRWEADAYLFFLAVIGYGLALCGYGARRFGQESRVGDSLESSGSLSISWE